MTEDHSTEPPFPKAPEIDRRVALPRRRMVGIVVILIVPVLAMFGVFGESSDRVSVVGPNVSAAVEFPTRFRYEMLHTITASILNRAARPIDTVTVRLDSAYALRFSAVTFTPAAERAYEVPLTDIAPGETRLVVIEMQGMRYGRHSGRLQIESTSGDTLTVPVHTLIFP